MDADERDICMYLKSWPGQFISGREIARRAGSKWRYEEEPEWAAPALARLVEKGLVESDFNGHFRLMRKGKKDKATRWISPRIREILRRAGKDPDAGTEPGEPESE